MSDAPDDKEQDTVLCPNCAAAIPLDAETCPHCGQATGLADDEGEEAPIPLSTSPPSSNGFGSLDITRDPTSLSPEELTYTVNSIRKKVVDNEKVPDAEIAYALKCISIMRQARPQKPSATREKVVARQMNLDDF